ncbi:thiamine phosphate synthase [Sporosarcina sp. CAU 1771]
MITKKLKLIFTMETGSTESHESLFILEEALKGGITSFRLTETEAKSLEFAKECKELCRTYGVSFIVNKEIETAIALDADGVHIEFKNCAGVRERIGPSKLLGVTVNTAREAFSAVDAGANYIAVGPLFESENASSVAELELIREIVSQLPGLPVIGYGNISERKIGSVIRKGGSGVMISSVAAGEESIAEFVRRLKGQVLLSLTGVEMH